MEVIDKRSRGKLIPVDKDKFPNSSIDFVEEGIEIPEPQVSLAEVDRVYSDPRPRKKHVLIRQNAAETYYGGTRFIIPDSAKQRPNEGVVVSAGSEVDPVGDCKPGDLVVFSKYNAEPIDLDGEEFMLVRIEDVRLVREVTYAIGK